MNPTAVLLGSFALLVLLRFPIGFCLGVAALLGAWAAGLPLAVVAQRMAAGIDSFPLMAIPFFILAGELMVEGKIADRIMAMANVLVGRIRGGLGMVNVVDSMFFGGISGSTVADVSSLGAVMIPAMVRQGYHADFAVALTITTATQAVIIPPSHNMVIYSLASGGTSVGRLFLGGIIPGILLGLSLLLAVYILARVRNYPRGEKVGLREALRALRDGFAALLAAVIIMGGIVSGIFTATESAAIASVYAFFLTFFVYRDLPLRAIPVVLEKSVRTIAIVMLLIASASAFGWMLAFLEVPKQATQFLLSLSTDRNVILLIVNVLLLLLGCIMDMAPIILTVTPILMPVMQQIGVDPVHFGIIMMINLGIGLVTPPVGSALFVGCAIGQIPIERVLKPMALLLPFMIGTLMLVNYVPALTMWIPNLVMPVR